MMLGAAEHLPNLGWVVHKKGHRWQMHCVVVRKNARHNSDAPLLQRHALGACPHLLAHFVHEGFAQALLGQLALQHLLLNAASHQHAVDPHALGLALTPHLTQAAAAVHEKHRVWGRC